MSTGDTMTEPTSTKPTVFEALQAVMADVQGIAKSDRNEQQRFNFRGIDAVMNAVGPAFRRHGIICVPITTDAQHRDVRTANDKPSRECTVTVTYRFYGPAGDFIDAQVPGESMDVGDKGTPKAMSVAYRTLLLQTLCIPTDEPDPDSQTYERATATISANDLRDGALAAKGDQDRLRALYKQAGRMEHLHAEVINETGDTEPLGVMITRLAQTTAPAAV